MRQSVLLLFLAVGALCMFCSNCRCSEARSPAQKVSSAPSGPVADPAIPRSLLRASFEATTTKHFVLLHEPGAAYVTDVCATLEYADKYFREVFSQAGFRLSPPKDRLVWICFPRKRDFSEYALEVEGMDLSWLDGYYSTLTNRVAIVQKDVRTRDGQEAGPPGPSDVRVAVAADRLPHEGVLPMSEAGPRLDITRLTHELAHQLSFNSGIQKRGVMYPLWVSEGLATNFEFEGTRTAGLKHRNTARCNGLLEAYATGELVPLRQFVVQTTVPPDARAGRRYYAQAWGFFQFALTQRVENLRAYLRRLAQERPERRDTATMLAEFTEAFGPPEALEPSWNAYLARQAQQAWTNQLAESAESGARMAQTP